MQQFACYIQVFQGGLSFGKLPLKNQDATEQRQKVLPAVRQLFNYAIMVTDY